MTVEGLFIIIVLFLLLVRIIQLRKEIFRTNLLSLLIGGWDILAVFVFVLIMESWFSHLIFILIAINALTWATFYALLRSAGYRFTAIAGLFLFLLYQAAAHYNVPQPEQPLIWFLTVLATGATTLSVLTGFLIGQRFRAANIVVSGTFFLLLSIIPLLYLLYFIAFDQPVGADQVGALFQSDLQEGTEFLSMHLSFGTGMLILFTFVYPYVLTALDRKKPELSFSKWWLLTVFLLVAINLNVWERIPLFTHLQENWKKYEKELELFRKELAKRKVDKSVLKAEKTGNNELYIVVIGESQNKNHMHLYGYYRPTTPLLDSIFAKGKLIKLENAYANHTHTVPVLTLSLTSANQLNRENWFNSPSVIDIFDRAGMDTWWLSNQVRYGGWDNPVTVLAESAGHHVFINKSIGETTFTINLDEQLVKRLKDIVSNDVNGNTVIFVHLMGNHGEYHKRYPKSFRKFDGEEGLRKIYGADTKWHTSINTYDNSMLYVDRITANIIDIAKSYDKGPASVIYMADHSEDAAHGKGHDAGRFEYSMIQIPLFFWFSDAYRQVYPQVPENLSAHRNQLFPNDFFYDLLIGITGVKTKRYQPDFDISNQSYQVDPDSCYTYHRKRKVNVSENYYYTQFVNAKRLLASPYAEKVIPHRVNTLGKASTVFYDGFAGVETDVVFRQDADSNWFEVGHDADVMSGMSLNEFLKAFNHQEIRKLWLDIKNLDDSGMDAAIKRLETLDKRYGLKRFAITESGMTTNAFARMSEAGFHTSYYLPTGIKDQPESEWPAIAGKIAGQVKRQKTQAVSFDVALYPFVKQYLEPLLNESVVYHTWDLGLWLNELNFMEKLSQKPFASDSRVKTLLIKYKSDYEL